ncbi:MAG: trehalose-6-phosphate synthase [Acidobacteriota bacterium]|nr:trehalose-6-phosphate synthase [Acidobacteriota bacterium]
MLREDRTPAGPASPGAPAPSTRSDFVVVANRLPLRLSTARNAEGWRPSPGGLVSALTSVLQSRDGVWIGWPGTSECADVPARHEGIRLVPVPISDQEYEDFYLGFSNATLWPLYHDAIRPPTFHRAWWHSYRQVNERYAAAAAESVAPDGTVWIHDYQLQLVPQMLRELRPDVRIGFFLHIPFPPAELFAQLPWRRELLTGLLGADLLGFQVPTAAANFSRLARRMSSATGTDSALTVDGRRVRVGAFPISVDCDQIAALAADSDIRARAKEIRRDLGDPELILLGVDRLDYTKGIQQRIKAVAELFADGSLATGSHVMVQVAVPSRESDPHYERERHDLEQVVSEMNGEHGQLGSPVVHYLHQNLPFEELLALYLAADVMLVTPFRDGMNLVAKEYVMSRTDLSGRLVLSEFAGAAAQLRGAFMVNPHDLDGMKAGIRSAVRAGSRETRNRMARMRRKVCSQSVYDWAQSFLAALA